MVLRMHFLADESCDFSVVRALRETGHDVLAVCDIAPRAPDTVVIKIAREEKRILLTEDKDFGQLVYASVKKKGGVIFIRFPTKLRTSLAREVCDLVAKKGERLMGSFVVMQPGRTRILEFD